MPEEIIHAGERKPTERYNGIRRKKKEIPSRTAVFLIHWQWLPMLVSAPLFILPSPWPLIPIFVVLAVWLTIWLAGGEPDTVKSRQEILVITIRGLSVAPGANDWYIARFQSLVNYCILQGIPIITMEDLYRLQSGSWIKGMRANQSWHLSN